MSVSTALILKVTLHGLKCSYVLISKADDFNSQLRFLKHLFLLRHLKVTPIFKYVSVCPYLEEKLIARVIYVQKGNFKPAGRKHTSRTQMLKHSSTCPASLLTIDIPNSSPLCPHRPCHHHHTHQLHHFINHTSSQLLFVWVTACLLACLLGPNT